MTDPAFLAGFTLGALLIGSIFTLYLTRRPRRRREIPTWTDEHYQQPPVVTRVTVNRHRSFDI